MAEDHRRLGEELVQEGVLLDDPGFLKEIVERMLRQVLETQMTEHVGSALPFGEIFSFRVYSTAQICLHRCRLSS